MRAKTFVLRMFARPSHCDGLWICGNVRTRFRSEVSRRRCNARGFLQFDERRFGGRAKLAGLVTGRTCAACGYGVSVSIEIHLERPYIGARRTQREVAGKRCRALERGYLGQERVALSSEC